MHATQFQEKKSFPVDQMKYCYWTIFGQQTLNMDFHSGGTGEDPQEFQDEAETILTSFQIIAWKIQILASFRVSHLQDFPQFSHNIPYNIPYDIPPTRFFTLTQNGRVTQTGWVTEP